MFIAYVRPQWEYLDSLYPQRVQTGTVTRRFESFLQVERQRPLFNYEIVFGHWDETFPDSLVLRPYRRDMMTCGDVVTDFWNNAQLPWDSLLSPGDDPNPRIGAKATELLRVLSVVIAAAEIPLSHYYKWHLFKQGTKTAITAFTDDPPFRGLTYRLIEDLHSFFCASNNAFLQRFLLNGSEELFSLPSPETLPPPTLWDIRNASPEDANRAALYLGSMIIGGQRMTE